MPALEENNQQITAAQPDQSAISQVQSTDGQTDDRHPKRRKRNSTGSNNGMGKELTLEQKAIVKNYVTRTIAEGAVKCSYCNKEISSRNIDRWASHLRGCAKTPDDIKTQIQPFRGNSPPPAEDPVRVIQPPVKTLDLSGGHTPTAGIVMPIAPSTTTTHLSAPSVNPMGTCYNEVFKVHVSKDYMKFNAAHFIAYKGFREKLHGHNYRLAVTITGQVGPDGYVVDFGEIKKISRVICKDLNESFLVPMNSDALKISFDETNVHILTEDMAKFSFPKADCSLLPIVHSSAEELAIYISNQLIDAFTMVALLERGARKIEVSISEANQQFASYERTIMA